MKQILETKQKRIIELDNKDIIELLKIKKIIDKDHKNYISVIDEDDNCITSENPIKIIIESNKVENI